MKKIFSVMLWACCMMCIGCTGSGDKGTEVMLETTAGNIKVRLFDDTPGHRDNFVKNVKDGMYDGVMFHRVIRNFMVQTGDPSTRPSGYEVPRDENGDTIPERIPAEIRFPQHYNKRGMLAAARDEDYENPERASDRFQFYIVTGKTHTEEDMIGYEKGREARDADILFQQKQVAHKDELEKLRANRDRNGVSDLLSKLQDEARYETSLNPPIEYPSDVKKAYRVHGGAPWLDNEYTVFGEVVEGMKVVDEIQKVKTNSNDNPLKEIRIVKAYVVE